MTTFSRHDDNGVVTLTLERDAVHNAFDAALIRELTAAIEGCEQDRSCRAIVLTGRGASFSAGADLNWMQSQLTASEAENEADAKQLAQLMRSLAYCSKTTIALVNGAAYGGGVGLIACCDIAIAVTTAKFGLTETRLGLVPAVISPYVMDAIGVRQSLRYFQTAEIFDATTAFRLGLVHELAPAEHLHDALAAVLKSLRAAGPVAVKTAKALVHRVAGVSVDDQLYIDEENAKLIAQLRVSSEGQEGLSAFLQKRKPAWLVSST